MQLRALSLTACTHILSFDHFLGALDSCTCLRELHLEDTLHRLSGNWIHAERDPASCRRPLISFPHLDSLVLRAHGAICTARFLAYLHIRPSARLEVSAEAEDAEADGPNGARSMASMLRTDVDPIVTLEPLAMVNALDMSMSMGRDTARISEEYIPWDPRPVRVRL